MQRQRRYGVVSPSIFMTLGHLKAIQADNYIGKNGVEYSAEEVDFLVREKSQKKAHESVTQLHREHAHLEMVATRADPMERHLNTLQARQKYAEAVDALVDGLSELSETVDLPPNILRALIQVQKQKLNQFLPAPF